MEKIVTLIIFYTILVFADVVPLIKSMNWKPVWFIILVYFITFAMQLLLALDVIQIDLDAMITKVLSSILK